MKKISLIIICVNIVLFSQAQTNITNALNSLNNGLLDDAKSSIDKAEADPNTNENYKTFYYKARIYQDIGLTDNPKYKNLCKNCFDIAFESYLKALVLNVVKPELKNLDLSTEAGLLQLAKSINAHDGLNTEDQDALNDILRNKIPALSNAFFNIGVAHYKDKNYLKSLEYFQKSLTIAIITNIVDPQLYYLTSLAALRAENYELAIKYSDLLIEINYGSTNDEKVAIILNKAIAQRNSGNESEMLITLDKGIKAYPNENYSLIIEKFNYYLKKKDFEKALDCINIAVEQNPRNSSMIITRATLFKELNRKQEASEDYLKAINIDPENYDANLNLGAYYFNIGIDTLKWADSNISPEKSEEYAKYKNVAQDNLKKALPFLEKANAIKPNNVNVLSSLKTAYYRIGELEKYYKVSADLDAISR